MLTFPAALSGNDAQAFLDKHWQKAPLWMPAAADFGDLPRIEADEVAWLATLEDVESRLIVTDISGSRCRYRVQEGPFESRQLEALPPGNWTLLVQDVDKHLPDFRRFFSLVPFIPDWRLDDLMISVAAPGGSVGPHVDNYDVFLVQLQGTRAWHWTTDAVPADPGASEELRLVQPFAAGAGTRAQPGDVLYLNPGVAHHGVAQGAAGAELCMSCSIGMRAPQLAELAGRPVGDRDPFYSDPDLEISESRPGYIAPAAINRLQQLLAEHRLDLPDAEEALGRFATSTKPWLEPDAGFDPATLAGGLVLHGMARLAWSNRRIFANGHSRRLPRDAVPLIEALCRDRTLGDRQRQAWANREETAVLLDWLLQKGVFDVAADPE